MRVYTRGLTALDHAAIQHTSDMIQDGTIKDVDIAPDAAIAKTKLALTGAIKDSDIAPDAAIATSKLADDAGITLTKLADEAKAWNLLNRVKLPAPATSDYVTPSAASASSSRYTPAFDEVIRRHADGVTNEENIYDGNGETYATPGFTLGAKSSYEMIVWDLGTEAERTVHFKHYSGDVYVFSYIDTSSDDATWTTQNTANNGTSEATFTATFRYIRWVCKNDSPNDMGASYARMFYLWVGRVLPDVTIDDDTVTKWRPYPANEANAWCQWDTGAAKILAGCRIYWGTDTNYLPQAYRIQVSEDGSTWEDVVTETSPPPAGAWKEYSWRARYGRYIRLIVDEHGPSGTEIYEMDYYSRLVDRVASEHGHGSGVTQHLRGHGVRPFESLRKKRDLDSLIKRIELLENLVL